MFKKIAALSIAIGLTTGASLCAEAFTFFNPTDHNIYVVGVELQPASAPLITRLEDRFPVLLPGKQVTLDLTVDQTAAYILFENNSWTVPCELLRPQETYAIVFKGTLLKLVNVADQCNCLIVQADGTQQATDNSYTHFLRRLFIRAG